MALVKYNNNSISAVTATGLASGSLVPIKTLTASSSGTLSFVHGTDGVVLDSTYPIYKFEFINIHPQNDGGGIYFQFNMSIDAGSNYNVTKTSTNFHAYNQESGTYGLEYYAAGDLAQSTSDQIIATGMGNENDQSVSGELSLYSPSSTTFVKHFIARMQTLQFNDTALDSYIAGYGNTTSDVDGIIFRMSSGNIDSGKIKLYGIKDS